LPKSEISNFLIQLFFQRFLVQADDDLCTDAKTRAFMTTPAILEIQIAAKGPTPIVTGGA
jgi:hypothetical protein